MTAVAPPTALPPARRTLRHRLRVRRAAALPGVTVGDRVLLGRGVVLDVAAGARVELADGSVLMDGCRIHARAGVVRIGPGAILGERCVVLAHERVEIGGRCVLGDGVVLVDFEHGLGDAERPVRLQPLLTAAVRVGDGARIGPGAVLERGAGVPPGGTVGAQQVRGSGGVRRAAPVPARHTGNRGRGRP